MDDEDKMLATALRDLCGWSPGMVTGWGHVLVTATRTSEIENGCSHYDGSACSHTELCEYDLPDLDAPANWGVWLAWMQSAHLVQSATVQIGPKGSFCEVDPVQGRSGFVDGPRGPASNLLAAFMLAMPDGAPPVPSSVTAWWQAQQKEHSNG